MDSYSTIRVSVCMSLIPYRQVLVWLYNSLSRFLKKLIKFWPPPKMWFIYAKKWPMQNIFSVVQKLWPHKAFKKTPNSLIGVKNSLQRKYGFMVLPEKVLRSRIRNCYPFQNISLLAGVSIWRSDIFLPWVRILHL